ncbi:MAG: hypothetical protein WBA97_22980 [Actinophytocola sp.]|uniref:hypothetical protein n=1 Tax=Actinophytocola sp. TaxID=1872138 RepID=UPI003C780E2A
MTGWQGNDGGQGGWNPQSFGPDPGTNKYGTDPYVNQYGSDPYSDPYAQADPYAQHQQPGYQTGGFPAQGYPPPGGFPGQGYPPPPPPKRSKLPMILSLVAIVIIVGAVVAIVLVNRDDGQAAAPQDPSTSESTTESGPTSESTESSTSNAPPTTGGTTHDDWLTIDNTADAGLTYQVPPDWKEAPTSRQSGLDVEFTGDADYGLYDCGGGSYVRTFAASGDVQGKDGKDLDLPATLGDFATSFATTYYGSDAKVDMPAPTETTVSGKTAMTVTAKVTQTVTKPECQASSGEIALVGVLLESDGQPSGVAMLVVVNDLEGGPADPKPLDASVSQEILKTVSAG